jgi:UDP-N-acetylmuramate--alanine ligase
MGIGGQGISAVAQIALLGSEIVSGCDRYPSATVHALQEAGIAVQIGHSVDHLEGVERLIISPAVPALDQQNPELLAARQRGIEVVTWQEMLGELMHDKCVLSVCGVHGKSTTTSMLSLLLTDAGFDPTCIIGAVVPRFGVNYRLGQSLYCVNEADEFNHNFWHYHPRLTVVKSIEFEHPEFFANYEMFLEAFEHFIRGMDMDGNWPFPPTVLLNADSQGCLELRSRLQDWPGRMLTYSVSGSLLLNEPVAFEAFDVRLDGETSFRVRVRAGAVFPEDRVLHLQLPGVHNVENALAALAAARLVGVGVECIVKTLESFGGTRRRFEIRHQGPLFQMPARVEDVMLVDDYAHHPTAIQATLDAARHRYLGRRLVAVYQPHMYSRTKAFFDQFLLAFDAADVVIISDIFPAREHDTGLVHSRDLVAALRGRRGRTSSFPTSQDGQVLHGGSVAETADLLATVIESGDLVIIMGAGDIYTVTEQLLHMDGSRRDSASRLSGAKLQSSSYEVLGRLDDI